jgi:DNA-binding transcriptional LysR family regulator
MDIPNLQAFVAVAEQASFSVAAERLFLTQPAVSKRITALEQELGSPLFDRIGRQVTLTEAGRALLPRARHILEAVEDSRRALSNLSERVEGPLSFGTSHHIGLHHLPPLLRAFTARYPAVDLDIRFLDSEEACQAVLHGDLELAVVTLPEPAPAKLATRVLWDDPLTVVVGRDHPLAVRKRVGPEVLAASPAVLPGQDTFTRALVESAFAAHGLHPAVKLSTNYLETIKMLVSVGLGWSVLPHTLVDDDTVALRVPELALLRHLGVVHHASRTLSNAGRAMLRLLEGER